MDYPKSESSTCLKILHARLNNQNTLKIFFLQTNPPTNCAYQKKRKENNYPFLNCKHEGGGGETELNVVCAGLKNQSDRARTCYLPFNCGHSVVTPRSFKCFRNLAHLTNIQYIVSQMRINDLCGFKSNFKFS